MKIGELASASATPIETIRYYEREGLLPPPERTAGNYRVYDQAQLQRLQFIRYCRGLDMSLDEVRTLLRVKDDLGADCGSVDQLLDQHIAHVVQRIKELRQLEWQLRELRQRCCAPAGDCGILSGIAERAQAVRAPVERSHVV